MNWAETLKNQRTIIHQLDPRIKLVIVFLLILSNLLLPNGSWLSFTIIWGFIIIIIGASKTSFGFVMKRSLIIFPFLLAGLAILFTQDGTPMVSFNLWGNNLFITNEGLVKYISLVIRSWLSIQAAILLTATTDFPEIGHGLLHLHVPDVLVAVILFMYRYLDVLVDEISRLIRGRNSRSAQIGDKKNRNIFWHTKVAGNMVGQLFVRSIERSERIYQAMSARGYQGALLTVRRHHMQEKDWIALWISVLFILTIQWVGLKQLGL
ncbi:MAG: cobalt ECF transporter T component CbiQ [Anaerolineales bacterium]|nr:cobalt ECF transporter T component CbiQ [Anaerolineales bacterium]